MTFGNEWGWGADFDVCSQVFEAFAAAGGNFIDTANYYTGGTSERYLGEMLKADRERFVVGTKFSLATRKNDLNSGGNHRKNIRQSLEASLKRLQTDYIDLYWLHAWDFTTGPEELMRTLDDLVTAGKVLYLGISDTPAWIAAWANGMAAYTGREAFTALQIEYSLIQRTPERDLLPMARAFGMAVTPWSPLASGLLTGKYRSSGDDDARRLKESSARFSERNLRIVETLCRLADQTGYSPAALALRWLLNRNTIPIVGARTVEQLHANLKATEVDLPAQAFQEVDEASKVELGFPHEFLASENITEIIFGGMKNRFRTMY
jgi:aryl-alcohol dehydrogenase-like predicted oxidoreductase